MMDPSSSIQPLLSLLGLARRANRIAPGFDAAVSALTEHLSDAVFITTDCAPRTERNIRRIAAENRAEVLSLSCTKAELGHAIGCSPTGVLVLTDRGFLRKARTLIPNAETIQGGKK